MLGQISYAGGRLGADLDGLQRSNCPKVRGGGPLAVPTATFNVLVPDQRYLDY
jgi:hypothetical protein